MGERLEAPNAQKVLYVDAEMPAGEVKKRFDSLKINYGQLDLLDQNLGFFFPREKRKRLNLLLEDDQSLIESYLVGRKLLVLDNLGKMLPVRGEVNEKQWGYFFLWLEKVSRKGITVLLVHHENKVGGHRGTGKITDDVDLVLSIKKVVGKEENSNAIELNIEDSRFLYGNDCDPFVLEYCVGGTRLVDTSTERVKQKGLSLVDKITEADFVRMEAYLVEKNFKHHLLNERHRLILACLCSGKCTSVMRNQFDDRLDRGKETWQKDFKDLVNWKILVKEGGGSVFVYKLLFPVSL